MEHQVYVNCWFRPITVEQMKQKWAEAGLPLKVLKISTAFPGKPTFDAFIPYGHPGWSVVKKWLQDHGCVPDDSRQLKRYTRKDLMQCQLLGWHGGKIEQGYVEGFHQTLLRRGRTCTRCVTGADPEGPLRVRGSELHRTGHFIYTECLDCLVSFDLAIAIAPMLPNAKEVLRDIVDICSGKTLSWKWLRPTHVMPPFSARSTGLWLTPDEHLAPCPECRRDGWHTTSLLPLELRYSRAALLAGQAAGCAVSWEGFGKTKLCPEDGPDRWYIAPPKVLLSLRVVKLLWEFKVRVSWEPVFLDPDA
jgi:hypothetical protein